jgi:hypothetical protein
MIKSIIDAAAQSRSAIGSHGYKCQFPESDLETNVTAFCFRLFPTIIPTPRPTA